MFHFQCHGSDQHITPQHVTFTLSLRPWKQVSLLLCIDSSRPSVTPKRCALSHSKSHFIGLGATVPGPSPVLKGFGARQLQRHCWSGFAIGASHSFSAAEQRVQAGQQFETAEAFRAGTVLSSKAGESKCARQTALERQDLSCTYLAHHELESVKNYY